MGIRVLSLFDGISCGRLALERVGVEVDAYYTCEIDIYAIAVSDYHYPDNIKLGNIKDLDTLLPTLPQIDLLIGGSPCQSFSLAGNRLNFDDPRGQLFFDYLNTLAWLRAKNPNIKFLLENVKMKGTIRDAISDAIGVQPVLINSALVSAQNRERYYWTNLEVTPLEDKGLLLKDVILGNVELDYGAPQCIAVRGRDQEDGERVQMAEPRFDGKTNALTSVQKDNMVLEEPVLLSNIYGGFDESVPRVHTKKSPTIRTSSGGGHIPSVVDETKLSEKAVAYMSRLRKGKPRWDYHTNPLDGKAACLTANMCKGVPYGVIKECLRTLHPIECERLQTLPDDWTAIGVFNGVEKPVSKTQRYKMIGNGWTVDVVAHILKSIK